MLPARPSISSGPEIAVPAAASSRLLDRIPLEVLERLARLDDQSRSEVLRRMELLPVPLAGEAIELLGEFVQGVGHGRFDRLRKWNRCQTVIHGVNDCHASPGPRTDLGENILPTRKTLSKFT
jgi:hypothetical protein